MNRNFVIDGTGNAVRPGDRVVVRQLMISDDSGPGIVLEVIDEGYVSVLLDGRAYSKEVSVLRLCREDDDERVNGHPLWSWT